jgi:hypothetical protein
MATHADTGEIYFATRLSAPEVRTGVLQVPRAACKESWQAFLSKYRDIWKVRSEEGSDEDGNEPSGYKYWFSWIGDGKSEGHLVSKRVGKYAS